MTAHAVQKLQLRLADCVSKSAVHRTEDVRNMALARSRSMLRTQSRNMVSVTANIRGSYVVD